MLPRIAYADEAVRKYMISVKRRRRRVLAGMLAYMFLA